MSASVDRHTGHLADSLSSAASFTALPKRPLSLNRLVNSLREKKVVSARITDHSEVITGPEVLFEAVHTRSNVFQAQVVIHRVPQFLFASEIVLGRLNGCMAKQELNLFKLSPRQVAESCAGTP